MAAKDIVQSASGLVTLAPSGSPVPRLYLDTAAPDSSVAVGATFWDPAEDTAVTHRSNGKQYAHGSELWKRCINKTAALIPNGSPVYVVGAQGDRPKIALASAASAATSKIIGIATEDIEVNAEGDVAVSGDVNGIDTSIYSLGDELWLSPTWYGLMTNMMPGNGYQRVFIGVVTRVHATAGRIQIAPYRFPMASELLNETWNDLLFLRSAKAGASAPTYAQFGTSAFWCWKMVAGDIFYHDDGQMPHSWDLSPIRPHMHFSSDNGGTGSITMEHRIMSKPADTGAWSAESISTKTWTGTLAAGAGTVMDLFDGSGYQPPSPGPSTMIKAVLTMLAKTFTGNIVIDGWDAHYKSGSFGTLTEY